MRATGGWLVGSGNRASRAGGILDVTGLGLRSWVSTLEPLLFFCRRSGVDLVALLLGDLVRLAESNSQCFQLAS